MREIVLDTETTGMDPDKGDRLVELGCIELENHLPTGRHFHVYINPERDVPAEAVAVHGLTADFLSGHPVFAEIVGGFLDFIADSPLIIHNAEFDLKFLNAELKRTGFPPLSAARVTDTLMVARQKFPGQPASLDALCRRFAIDNSNRTLHGALLDSQLLAEVYLELMGGRQHGLGLASAASAHAEGGIASGGASGEKPLRPARRFALPPEEAAAHEKMVQGLKNPLWKIENGG